MQSVAEEEGRGSSTGRAVPGAYAAGTITLEIQGNWTRHARTDRADDIIKQLQSLSDLKTLAFESSRLEDWDSVLLVFLMHLHSVFKERGVALDSEGLPAGVRRLVKLALAVPYKSDAKSAESKKTLLSIIGKQSVDFFHEVAATLEFFGGACVAFLNLLRGKARVPLRDLKELLEETGPEALPIVTLISSLVGLILAYIGAVQLQQFGAEIYVANLVGLAIAREMGPIMAGVIMAGRTGAAFAAKLGTMQVNEETDALATLGIDPMEFLVLPRMLALMIMMPLLCIYADVMGVLGGALVTVATFDISLLQFFEQLRVAVGLHDILIGVVKGVVFAVLVAVTGCLYGMRCGRSASAVGEAVTSAVVSGIVCIVVVDAIFAVITGVLGI